jgi:hypothetical protein
MWLYLKTLAPLPYFETSVISLRKIGSADRLRYVFTARAEFDHLANVISAIQQITSIFVHRVPHVPQRLMDAYLHPGVGNIQHFEP